MEHVSALVLISDLATISAGVVISVSRTNSILIHEIAKPIDY